MYVIRPINFSDLDALVACAYRTRIGITNLPKNRKRLLQTIFDSEKAFSISNNKLTFDLYFFVLEDTKDSSVIGVCGIFSKKPGPIFYYREEYVSPAENFKYIPSKMRILRTVSYDEGPSEICALYLQPEIRHEGLGKLLSFSRFLFVASFPERFTDVISANMRGKLDQNDSSPFWTGLGYHFLNIDFGILMRLRDDSFEITSSMLPQYPIYPSILRHDAEDCIGHVDRHTLPALKMLQSQGFKYTDEIDVFDGGPIISASKNQIPLIKNSHLAYVKSVADALVMPCKVLITNGQLNFRCCMGEVSIVNENEVNIDTELAKALDVKIGQSVRYVLLGEK